MIWITALGVLLVIVYYVVLTRRTTRRSDTGPAQPAPEAKAVSIEQARAMVDELIAKRDEVFVEPADKASIPLAQLGPITGAFFSRVGALRTRRGGLRLASADVRPSDYAPGYLSIGHSEDWDVVLKPGTDEVFVVEGAETDEADMQVRFPSVYHLVLDEAQRQ